MVKFQIDEEHRPGLWLAAQILRAWARSQEQRNEHGEMLSEPAASHWAAARYSCASSLEHAVLAFTIEVPSELPTEESTSSQKSHQW